MSQDPSRRISRNDVRVRAWRAILEVPRQLTSIMDAELQEDIGMDLSTYDALLHVFEAGTALQTSIDGGGWHVPFTADGLGLDQLAFIVAED